MRAPSQLTGQTDPNMDYICGTNAELDSLVEVAPTESKSLARLFEETKDEWI